VTTYCCPKSVKACALRVTRLRNEGLPEDPLEISRTVQGSGFAELTLNPDYETGEQVQVRSPGGDLAVLHRDFDSLLGFEVTLRVCGIPLMLPLLLGMGVENIMWDTEFGGDVAGFALPDTIADACPPYPVMVEVWSKNVAATGALDDCSRWIHWVLPYTDHWTLSSNLSFSSGALEWEVSGYARRNEWWWPAFPGPTFPGYIGGVPLGAPPTVLPPEVTVPDPWTEFDVETIRASGPLAWKCVDALPEPLDDCAVIPGDNPCGQQVVFADGPFTAGGDGLLTDPPYDPGWLPWL
jgi:hypothetical protein